MSQGSGPNQSGKSKDGREGQAGKEIEGAADPGARKFADTGVAWAMTTLACARAKDEELGVTVTQGKGRFAGSSIRAAGGGPWATIMSPLRLKQCGPLDTLVPRRALRLSAVVLRLSAGPGAVNSRRSERPRLS